MYLYIVCIVYYLPPYTDRHILLKGTRYCVLGFMPTRSRRWASFVRVWTKPFSEYMYLLTSAPLLALLSLSVLLLSSHFSILSPSPLDLLTLSFFPLCPSREEQSRLSELSRHRQEMERSSRELTEEVTANKVRQANAYTNCPFPASASSNHSFPTAETPGAD